MRGRFGDHNQAVMDPHSKLEFAHGLGPTSARRPAPPEDSPIFDLAKFQSGSFLGQ
jgi:hypothetical protein